MKTTHAVWERENLGVDAYEIALAPEDTPEALAAEDQRLAAGGAQYLVVKTPVNCPRLLFGLGTLGYTFVETVYHVMIRRDEYRMPASVARFDRGLEVTLRTEADDVERICALVSQGVFVSDRVSLDPAFGVKMGGRRYANWLRSMARSGAWLYEVLRGGSPMGFFIIQRKDAATVDPVLMGLYDEQGDRGMGVLLHKKTLDTCFEHPCERLTSTIVSNNAKVLRVYLNAGATIADTLYTYVKHLRG